MGKWIIFTLLIVILFLTNIFTFKGYIQTKSALESITKSNDKLSGIKLDYESKLNDRLDNTTKEFRSNAYLIKGMDGGGVLVGISLVCSQKNGINCVYVKDGKLETVGNSYEI